MVNHDEHGFGSDVAVLVHEGVGYRITGVTFGILDHVALLVDRVRNHPIVTQDVLAARGNREHTFIHVVSSLGGIGIL